MSQKILDIIQGSIAFVIFLSILGVSTISVLALNPKASTTLKSNGSIAGESSLPSEVNEKNYTINNIGPSYAAFNTSMSFDPQRKEYSYQATVKPSATFVEERFIQIFNNSKDELNLEITTSLDGYIQQDIIIRIYDGMDFFTIYDPRSEQSSAEIQVAANEKKEIRMQYEFINKINFPIKARFTIK